MSKEEGITQYQINVVSEYGKSLQLLIYIKDKYGKLIVFPDPKKNKEKGKSLLELDLTNINELTLAKKKHQGKSGWFKFLDKSTQKVYKFRCGSDLIAKEFVNNLEWMTRKAKSDEKPTPSKNETNNNNNVNIQSTSQTNLNNLNVNSQIPINNNIPTNNFNQLPPNYTTPMMHPNMIPQYLYNPQMMMMMNHMYNSNLNLNQNQLTPNNSSNNLKDDSSPSIIHQHYHQFEDSHEKDLPPSYELSNSSGLDFQVNRYSSAFTTRENINIKAMVNGKETFREMYNCMMHAKQQIFISDWFLSPEVYLVRETDNGEKVWDDNYRLDNILKYKASQGVKIYIYIWNETNFALKLGSYRVEEVFEKVENIIVYRHPVVFPIKWSHHQKVLVIDQNIAFVGGLDMCFGRYDDEKHSLLDLNVEKFKGKDYYNPNFKSFKKLDHPFTDLIDRQTTPRMPWHDVHLLVDGYAARDLAKNFIEIWNYHQKKHKFIHKNHTLDIKTDIPLVYQQGTSKVQVVRSISTWSTDQVEDKEKSVYYAYLDLIMNAERFIYIENQYFISSTLDNNKKSEIKNKIARMLVQKIRNAILKKKIFNVVVVIPQRPEGSLKESSTRTVLGYEYKTICTGKDSIFGVLRSEFPNVDLSQYISFHHLRKCEGGNNKIFTEQIYIHTKLMIVDDKYVVIGSANLNDRSMLGNRDSEIAVVIEDTVQKEITLNGVPYVCSAFANNLRIRLWGEYLGSKIDEKSLIDPIYATNLLRKCSKSNTSIIDKVFPYVVYEKYPKIRITLQSTTMEWGSELNNLYGRVIDFDENYLSEELVNEFTKIDISAFSGIFI
eukprot:TRINITY_DN538_c0_g1_i1.p1 TRINITY_DN538_c0_g1~~TRINITY_DN538_c0_g1_i1.p1  ORF type:complete len:830 (-),score=214.00 TRINITY_DN538_c0_g1_i1:85-2574(-)